MGAHFVFGENMDAALERARAEGETYSFDMLGEAARTSEGRRGLFRVIRECDKACRRLCAGERRVRRFDQTIRTASAL